MTQSTLAMNALDVVVIGHGMVGHKFLESVLADAAHAARNVRVTVLCEEPRPAYDRVHLSEFFAGKSADDLSLVSAGFFEREDVRDRVRLVLDAKVVSIDRAAHTVSVPAVQLLRGFRDLVGRYRRFAIRLSRLSDRAAREHHATAVMDAPLRFRSRGRRASVLGGRAADPDRGARALLRRA